MQAAPPAPQPPPAGTGVRRELDIFASLRSHWLACCLIFAVAALVLGNLAVGTVQRTYTSSASLRVARTFPRTLQGDRELELGSSYDYDSFRNDQVALLLRPDVLLDALQRAGQLGPPWGTPDTQHTILAARFAASLQINAVPKSTRIEITLSSTDAESLQPALNALLAAFEDAHRKEYFFAEDARPDTLRAALVEVEASIASKRNEINALATELGITGFAQVTTNPWSASLESSRTALATARRELTRALARRDLTVAAATVPLKADELLSGTSAWAELSASLRDALSPLADERAAIEARLAGLGEGHPARDGLLQQIRELEQRVLQIGARQADSLVIAAESAVGEVQAEVDQLQVEVADLEAKHADFVTRFQRGRILEEEMPREMSLRDRLSQRLEFFVFEAQSPSYADVIQGASEVDPRGDSNLKRNLAIALFLALMLALGLPILWDLRDDFVHTPADVLRALGIPVAAWLPRSGRFARQLHTTQLQRFALALDRDRKRHGARILVFTGVKTEKVMELAKAVATSLRSLERRTLLVDATGSDYDSHPQVMGLIGLLTGGPLETVQLGGAGEFLPWGRVEDGSPCWDNWPQTLVDATRDYDVVLVAASSLLAAPTSEMLVEGADLAIVAVEAENERLGEVARAGQLLRTLKPKAIGSVLTNVRPFRSRGYYRKLG